MPAVDVHGHCVPQAFLTEIAASRAFGVEVAQAEDGYRVAFPGRPPLRPIAGVMLDGPERARWLGEQGLTRQIVGPWLDLQGQELPAGHGANWAGLLNDALAGTVAADPRLAGWATVHLADPDTAAAELARAITELGLVGLLLPATPPSGRLADPANDALWTVAEELGVPVMVHASTASPAAAMLRDYPVLNGLFARNIDVSLALAELVVSGVCDRFPELRLLAVHGGGLLPFHTGRFDNDTRAGRTGLRPASEIVAAFHYDTVLLTEPSIRLLLDLAGPDKVMLGSDFGATPAERGGVSVTGPARAACPDPDVRDAVFAGNARAFFDLRTAKRDRSV